MSRSSTTSSSEPSTATSSPPEITLLIENPSKGKNWGPLLRCCSAFGISTIYVVGYDRCSVQGSHGASKHVQLVSFPTHQAAVDFLTKRSNNRADNNDGVTATEGGGEGFELVGLLNGVAIDYNNNNNNDDDDDGGYPVVCKEVILNSVTGERKLFAVAVTNQPSTTANHDLEGNGINTFPVQSRKFVARRICLVVDRTTGCLPWSLAQHCTRFVHIPHFGGSFTTAHGRSDDSFPPTTWITMEACVSIVLHEFSECYFGSHNGSDDDNDKKNNSSNYTGQKYQVDRICKGGGSKDSEIARERNEERQRKRLEQQKEETDQLGDEDCFFGFSLNRSDNSDY